VRTPMTDYVGALKDLSALELGAIASRGAFERYGIKPEWVDHAVFGNVLQTSADAIYGARHIALKAGVPAPRLALRDPFAVRALVAVLVVATFVAAGGERTLYVSGCVPNQGRFYDRFDAVVLLSAPANVILSRIATRTTNDFGKPPCERAQILADLESTEPRLRASCTHEIDATRPVDDVVEALIAIGLSG